MKKLALACFLVGSHCFALLANAQTEELAVSTPTHQTELFRTPTPEITKDLPSAVSEKTLRIAPVSSPEIPYAYEPLYADAPPAPIFFPTDFDKMLPASFPKLLFGLLGLLVLGLLLFARSNFLSNKQS